MPKDRQPPDWDHWLWNVVGNIPNPRAEATTQDHRFHKTFLWRKLTTLLSLLTLLDLRRWRVPRAIGDSWGRDKKLHRPALPQELRHL